MFSTTKIGELASIRSGYAFRGKIESRTDGNIHVFQPKDILDGKLSGSHALIHPSDYKLNDHLLSKGDILITNKGTGFNSLLFNGEPAQSVASSSFFVIKVRPDLISSEYLFWFLNEPDVIEGLLKIVGGTSIPTLSKKDLENFEIMVPPKEIQKRITDLNEALREVVDLRNRLTQRKIEEYRSQYWRLITNKR